MMEGRKEVISGKYDMEAKWDECIDLTVRRFVYSSLAGAFSGFLLFRSPVSRWASVAFGAGVGIGSAYTECSQKFDGFPVRPPAKVYDAPPPPKAAPEPPASQEGQE